MDSIGTLVLIVATAAIGLAAIVAVVQLWRHQPVHEDQQTVPPPPSSVPEDEVTLDFGADEATRDLAEIEKTTVLGTTHKQD